MLLPGLSTCLEGEGCYHWRGRHISALCYNTKGPILQQWIKQNKWRTSLICGEITGQLLEKNGKGIIIFFCIIRDLK